MRCTIGCVASSGPRKRQQGTSMTNACLDFNRNMSGRGMDKHNLNKDESRANRREKHQHENDLKQDNSRAGSREEHQHEKYLSGEACNHAGGKASHL